MQQRITHSNGLAHKLMMDNNIKLYLYMHIVYLHT